MTLPLAWHCPWPYTGQPCRSTRQIINARWCKHCFDCTAQCVHGLVALLAPNSFQTSPFPVDCNSTGHGRCFWCPHCHQCGLTRPWIRSRRMSPELGRGHKSEPSLHSMMHDIICIICMYMHVHSCNRSPYCVTIVCYSYYQWTRWYK